MMLTADMFSSERDRRVFGYITKLMQQGKETDVTTMYQELGKEVIDLVPYMVGLTIDYPFDILKVKKNEQIRIMNYISGTDFNYFVETFNDYLDIFIKLVYNDEERERDFAVSGATATATR